MGVWLALVDDDDDDDGLNGLGLLSLLARAQRLINLEIPVLVRSLKSSNVELG